MGLESAEKVVKLVTRWEGPEPVRLVDKISRKMIRKWGVVRKLMFFKIFEIIRRTGTVLQQE